MNDLRVVLSALNDVERFNGQTTVALLVDLVGEYRPKDVELKDVVNFLERQKREAHRSRASKAKEVIDELADADFERYGTYLEAAEQRGIEFVTVLDEGYPEKLRWIDSPPLGLYVQGDPTTVENGVSVVGTRDATRSRLEYVERVAEKLVEMDRTVVSGLAKGVDTAAHEGTLAAGGGTVAVLPGDVETIRPRGNEELGERIADSGALVAEVSPEASFHRGRFVKRNRIISGICDAVVIGASGETGGTIRQADFAEAQGRARFLYDPPEDDEQSPAKVKDKGFLTFETVEELEALLERDADELPTADSRSRTLLDYT